MKTTRRFFMGMLGAIAASPAMARVRSYLPIKVTYLEASQDGGKTWSVVGRFVGTVAAAGSISLKTVGGKLVPTEMRHRVVYETRGKIIVPKDDAARSRYKGAA